MLLLIAAAVASGTTTQEEEVQPAKVDHSWRDILGRSRVGIHFLPAFHSSLSLMDPSFLA